jgi:uncharacterized OB-fold protein
MPEPAADASATTVAVMRCSACGTLDPGPRDLCPKCHARLTSAEVAGAGTLVSWTLIRRPPAAFKEDGQYAVAIVRLDVGVQVTGRLAESDARAVPGARVRATGRHRDTTVFSVG